MWVKVKTNELKLHIMSSNAYDSGLTDLLCRHPKVTGFEVEAIPDFEIFMTARNQQESPDLFSLLSKTGKISVTIGDLKILKRRIHKIRFIRGNCIKLYVNIVLCVIMTNEEYVSFLNGIFSIET